MRNGAVIATCWLRCNSFPRKVPFAKLRSCCGALPVDFSFFDGWATTWGGFLFQKCRTTRVCKRATWEVASHETLVLCGWTCGGRPDFSPAPNQRLSLLRAEHLRGGDSIWAGHPFFFSLHFDQRGNRGRPTQFINMLFLSTVCFTHPYHCCGT